MPTGSGLRYLIDAPGTIGRPIHAPIAREELIERCGAILAETLDAQGVPIYESRRLRKPAEMLADLLTEIVGKV